MDNINKSSFTEVMRKLYEETDETEIYAARAYNNEGPCIGFRREICGGLYKDPIIDEIPFMLAADAYNVKAAAKIKSLKDLITLSPDTIRLNLRANTLLSIPSAVIDLGSYKITNMTVENYFSTEGKDMRILLKIKRV